MSQSCPSSFLYIPFQILLVNYKNMRSMYLQMMISDETIAKEHEHGHGHVNQPIVVLQEECPNNITSHSESKPSFPIECSDDDDDDDYGNTHMV